MKLERLNEYVATAAVIGIGMGLALAAGKLTGEGQLKSVAIVLTGLGLIGVCLASRAAIWLIIPLCWEFTGTVPITNLPFSIRDGAVVLAGVCYLLLHALKIIRDRPRFDSIDLIIVLILAYLATVFVRNPVGSDWLGSEKVGGKPYFDISIAFLAYCVIVRVPMGGKSIQRLPFFMLFGSTFISLGGLINFLHPPSAFVLGQAYSGFAPPAPQTAVMTQDMIGRKPLLASVGNTGIRLWCSYFSPATFFSPLYPGRFLMAGLFLLAILLSGFRSMLMMAFVYICLASWFRKRYHDILLFGLVGAIVLATLALGNNRIFSLPLSAQRALSFLPGEWDYRAVADAQGSSQWRFEMWRLVLKEDRWIKNKWLGDGFGFTRYELSIMNSPQGFLGGNEQEISMINGTYHSGPLSTIRYAGAVGLVLYYTLLILAAVRAHRLIRSTYDTKLFPVVLFVGLPLIYTPFNFTFLGGFFDMNLAETLFLTGVLKLLERAHETSRANPKPESPLPDTVLAHPSRRPHRPDPAPVFRSIRSL